MVYVICVHLSAYVTPQRWQRYKCNPTRIFSKHFLFAGSLYKYLLAYALDLESKWSWVNYTLYLHRFTWGVNTCYTLLVSKYSSLIYKNRFVTQGITYLNIGEALSGTLSPLSTHDQLISQSWVDNGDKVPESASRIFK